jgi:hypothetical protein
MTLDSNHERRILRRSVASQFPRGSAILIDSGGGFGLDETRDVIRSARNGLELSSDPPRREPCQGPQQPREIRSPSAKPILHHPNRSFIDVFIALDHPERQAVDNSSSFEGQSDD